MIIVTASDSTHFNSLKNLLYSIHKNGVTAKVIVYDLGLQDKEISFIKDWCEVTPFDFVHITEDKRVFLAKYSWKSVIVNEVMEKYGGKILYLDAGSLVIDNLSSVGKYLDNHEFFIPTVGHSIGELTHSQTLSILNADSLYELKMRDASIFGFNSEKISTVIKKWLKHSLNPECLSPIGAFKSNHRFDQSILSILLYQYMGEPYVIRNIQFGISRHNDNVYLEELEALV